MNNKNKLTYSFRNYDNVQPNVIECYKDQRKFQSIDFYNYAINKYCKFDKQNTFWELFDLLKNFVDLSDPDISLTNHQHLWVDLLALLIVQPYYLFLLYF